MPPAPHPCRPSPLVASSPRALNRMPPERSVPPSVRPPPTQGLGPHLPHSLCTGAGIQLRESRESVPPRPGQGAPCRAPQACGSPPPMCHLWVSHPGPRRSCPRPPQPQPAAVPNTAGHLWYPGPAVQALGPWARVFLRP